MDVIKKEVGTCNYLKIMAFKYTRSNPETDRNGKTFMVHDFDIELVDNMTMQILTKYGRLLLITLRRSTTFSIFI